jgi:lipopolysaccharide/colanic/teichoic acid biosynthesis glycosyltransferase
MHFYHRVGKRWMDVLLAGAMLVCISPLIAVTATAVLCFAGQPILFVQRRPGRAGRLFRLYKFRTMTAATNVSGELLPDEQRLTAFGKFLRATSLDELPELWCVLRGDMSLVGPRPLLVEYLDHYTPSQARRHLIRPGLTGLAQIRGRNLTTWDERLRLDLWYVRRHSFWLDVKILVVTVVAVLSRRGISAAGHATMPRFDAQCCSALCHEQTA